MIGVAIGEMVGSNRSWARMIAASLCAECQVFQLERNGAVFNAVADVYPKQS